MSAKIVGQAEIRVERHGAMVDRVYWNPCTEHGEPIDLTHMHVVAVDRHVDPGSLPIVQVSFMARLVEVET